MNKNKRAIESEKMRVGPRGQFTGLPVPSVELGRVVWAKAWIRRFLKWRARREAGFTEQRKPPAPRSGRITGLCSLGPSVPSGRP
ncbi:hypothetical protein ACH5RR_027882 [Cinchona calisaya]|uniref:Uncharacterized protein n=1 Tax=Cinchona calisaya TaxID=153742 RepID=A0ABD2YPA8_9GENT